MQASIGFAALFLKGKAHSEFEAMGPRYDADYDAQQCEVRNDKACAACSNRVAFLGKRGAKGAWNKPCQGPIKPDPSGEGRLRCSYGGKKLQNLTAEPAAEPDADIRPHTPEPEFEHRALQPVVTASNDPERLADQGQTTCQSESDDEREDMNVDL